ncbi:glycosyltransferase family 4 protein [Luteolibacter flavescens]|uniref:Glycosyltransferase family 4 protein n=1 Tax=Luteolibacter flavescens TaxID=1859460 RepID=A0ABT3FUP7_9BACT|nr:glycosyltransferase family 4 protein [Luteolibacter flavescens]MCW1887313.1 glycosyltransferase family 4 protein [Luteolibacter flavescens]
MKILVIADPKIAVPPPQYGGAERIISYLCSEFHKLGHDVVLMAGPGSRLNGGELIVHHSPAPGKISRIHRRLLFHMTSMRQALTADVVLNFGRLDYLTPILASKIPLVCRFGNPVPQSQIDWLLARRSSNLRLIGVSLDQIKHLKSTAGWDVIYNSTDLEKFKFHPACSEPRYLAFLGRITHNKGADTAIRVARQAGLKLKIGGNIGDEAGDAEFFEKEIRPHLGEDVEWLGPVGDAAKQSLLGGAFATIFPIRWPEPFANVVVESLVCGTPVIATRCASTPEIITNGENGFLGDDEEALAGLVNRIPSVSRMTCRRGVEERFSAHGMARAYVRVIQELVEKGNAN